MDSATLNFADFPEDVQLSILSFLGPSEIFTFACTSKRFASLCRSDKKLWYFMCDRRWGSKTEIRKWGGGRITYKVLYRTLNEWEDLIGFWRRCGQGQSAGMEWPALVFFEFGVSYLSGFRVSPGRDGGYGVVKSPFLMMGLGEGGVIVNLLDPEGRCELGGELDVGKLGFVESDLLSVNVSFVGRNHLVVEENSRFSVQKKKNGISRSSSSGSMKLEDEDLGMMGGDGGLVGSPGSFPDRLMLDIYQYFANRTSPVSGDRATRRQRRREKERRKWEAEHFVKIANCSPTRDRPLQGLWKGISDDDTNLDFYLVTYDDIGGVACRTVGDSSKSFSSYSPVFWTSNSIFIESPFSPEEESIYGSRIHFRPSMEENYSNSRSHLISNEAVSGIMYVKSGHDLVIRNLSAYSRPVEGRIWQYQDGTFGFGFLGDSFVVDLKHITQAGRLLDVITPCGQ